jgi:hypothetical protein
MSSKNTVTFESQLDAELADLRAMLLAKNKAYGNSVLEPIRIFSNASMDEQIRVRLDDKLSRLKRGNDAGEDVIGDLIRYLIFLRISNKQP